MRHLAALAVAALCLMPAAPGLAGDPRPVSGPVMDVNRASGTIVVGGDTYVVPRDVYDVSRLEPGEPVIVHWERRGDRMVATQLEDREAGG